MLVRLTAVVAAILSAVWLARAPDWEPVIALLTAFSGYLGIEIVHYRKEKQKENSHGHISAESDIIERIHRLIDRMENEKKKHPEQSAARATMQHTQEELHGIFDRLRNDT